MGLQDGTNNKKEGQSIQRNLTNAETVVTSLIGGAVAGAIAKTVIAPLDRTKINFQIERKPFSFKEAYLFLNDSYQRFGVTSLWRGNTATLARVVPFAAINYSSHEQFKRLLEVETNAQKKSRPGCSFVAGSLAGVVSTTATYPLDVARARMAVTLPDTYKSLWSVFVKTVKDEGPRGLYRGYVPTILGVIPYAGTGFFTYETLKRLHFEFLGPEHPHPVEKFMFGAIAGFFAQTTSYPLDIVRRRMQTKPKYKSVLGTLQYVLKREGFFRGLYKGLSMNWIKGPIAVGISFSTFEIVTKFLRELPFYS